ncbi:OmpA family protein [Terrilactibacillus sp. BCM23-1]|uniref:OmpA family protein n=1 Tax=Terrilactibacillus tamarindi TaxID=2599694 RepID=A0A6N8CRI2_9BACI|nr:flagellar motor protein MotB [Terrilactibacillus tamarindi]MTT31545.1 OmpA family protein [Terrilactibacillus tamarindi]
MSRRKRRRRSEEEGGSNERWLITYSDLITLLLVFFIMLYSMSSVEAKKFNALVNSLKTAFQGDAIMQNTGYPESQSTDMPDIPFKKKPVVTKQRDEDKKKLDKLYVQLDNYIKENDLSPAVTLTNLERGVQLTFREKILFDLGDAEIKNEAKPVLKKIGGMLEKLPNNVSIEGHTDNNPISGHSKYPSNWDLSGARAQQVMFFLIKEDKLKPDRMNFVGYGEYQPIVKNDTKAHQAMNRRVNITILRQEK